MHSHLCCVVGMFIGIIEQFLELAFKTSTRLWYLCFFHVLTVSEPLVGKTEVHMCFLWF